MTQDVVLIVDDELEWQDNLKSILEGAGFICRAASDFSSAIRMLQLLDPLALVLDLQLDRKTCGESDWEGWLLARQAHVQGVSSVVVTGHAEAHISSRAFREFGVIDLFDKGCLVEHEPLFIQRVAEAIQITKQRQTEPERGRCIVQSVHLEQIDGRNKLCIDSPYLGQVRDDFAPPFSSDILDLLLQLVGERRASWSRLTAQEVGDLQEADLSRENSGRELLEEFGIKLYDALAYKKVGTALAMAIQDARKAGASLTLQLQFDESATDLVRYPWELVHNGRRFLVQGRISLVRYIAYSEAAPPLKLSFPLRVLTVVARPFGITPLPDVEEPQIRKAVDEAGVSESFQFERLEPPVTYENLVKKLNDAKWRGEPFHVLFYDGHGDFGWQCSDCREINGPEHTTCETETCQGTKNEYQKCQGYLLFESKSRHRDNLSSDRFATALADSGIQMAILSACNSAQVGERTPFNSIGPKLIEEGVPAVVGMQLPISFNDTVPFFCEFFRGIGTIGTGGQLDETSIDEAVKGARKLIPSDRWFHPVLYLRAQ